MSPEPNPDSSGELADERLRAQARLIEQFNTTGNLVDALLHGPTTVLDLIPAAAAAVHLDGATSTIGDPPEPAAFERVIELLRSTRRQLPIASDAIAVDHPQIAQLLPGVAGLLMVPIDGSRGLLAWFRPEIATSEGPRDRAEPPAETATGHAEPWNGLPDTAARFSREIDGAVMRHLHSELAHFGFHDALTGLSNGRLLADRIQHALDGPTRGAGVVLLFIDINSFTAINGSLGHARGDEFLIQAAERLRSITRISDCVARLAGDEFVILAGGVDRVGAARIAARVLNALERPFTVAGSQVRATVSVGIAEAEADDVGADLLRRARTAMNWAKDLGRSDQVVHGLSHATSWTAFMSGGRIQSW